MKLPRYSLIYNVVLFQLLWFTAVLGANQYLLVVALLLVLHWCWCSNRRAELFLLLTAATAGIICDSIMALAGVYVFASGTQTLPIPWWLIGLWLGFGLVFAGPKCPDRSGAGNGISTGIPHTLNQAQQTQLHLSV